MAACTAPSLVRTVMSASEAKEQATLTSGFPRRCFVHPTKPSPAPTNTMSTIMCPTTRRCCLPKKIDTAMLPKEMNAAYRTAAKAHRIASTMLPTERAGWKYTVMVATMCLPSFLPSMAAMKGTKVARLPRMYAREHFSMFMPVGDFAYA